MKQSTNSEVLNTKYFEAQNASRLVTYDKIIGYDAYGWPTYHLRVISFLRVLGVPENIIKQIPENILKTYISTSTDMCTNCNIDLEKGEIYVF